MTIAKKVQMP